ncbi:hypothetical protein MRB53_038996 [Persea americana]|nr:hypothetical protein MRB53_038996 [Persea americana]
MEIRDVSDDALLSSGSPGGLFWVLLWTRLMAGLAGAKCANQRSAPRHIRPYSIDHVVTSFFEDKKVNTDAGLLDLVGSLGLQELSSQTQFLRVELQRRFPDPSQPYGAIAWFLLQDLVPEKRYEVRICWPAIHPTAFEIATFSLQHVVETPRLIASLTDSSTNADKDLDFSSDSVSASTTNDEQKGTSSVLLLRISAAADYFTTNQDLMKEPPPVEVDITQIHIEKHWAQPGALARSGGGKHSVSIMKSSLLIPLDDSKDYETRQPSGTILSYSHSETLKHKHLLLSQLARGMLHCEMRSLAS